MRETLDFSLVESDFREEALAAWVDAGEIGTAFCYMSNELHLAFVHANAFALKDEGLYEKSLVKAYTGIRTNFRRWKTLAIKQMFELADREALCACGEPLPQGDAFKLYRGVAGHRKDRRVGGFSWTDDFEKAKWFAERFPIVDAVDPAVYTVKARRDEVLFFYNGRNEREFVLWTRRYWRTSWQPDPQKQAA